ncbi:MAG: RAMP superfamily CRISPR-associated protein [Campylobacter sp.]|nr:RAMP superfamily CRISPR-associated protein [Campylobacter sp.]
MKRLLAHIIIKAKTPLKVGSGDSDLFYDAPVQRDFNGLPMILGTSLAGILRAKFKGEIANEIFGSDKNEFGSRLIISNALLVDENGKVCEELLLESKKSEFIKIFDRLPIREHTAIDEKGATKQGSKFDEEVVYKGTMFKFSIEFLAQNDDDELKFQDVLNTLSDPTLRLGGGSSKGFGSFDVESIKTAEVDLKEYSSSLNYDVNWKKHKLNLADKSDFIKYELRLTPDDFFVFGSGFGDNDVDQIPVFEKVVDYNKRALSDEQILIPASSIKGALAHRTEFHDYKFMLDSGSDEYKETGDENAAVREIFGYKKDKNDNDGRKGKILISDCFKNFDNNTKVFEHVSIDRFTGGAIDGALFQEKTLATKEQFDIEILIKNDAKENELCAFEKALLDVSDGLLPLGGATTKGHGFFNGEVRKNDKNLERKNA